MMMQTMKKIINVSLSAANDGTRSEGLRGVWLDRTVDGKARITATNGYFMADIVVDDAELPDMLFDGPYFIPVASIQILKLIYKSAKGQVGISPAKVSTGFLLQHGGITLLVQPAKTLGINRPSIDLIKAPEGESTVSFNAEYLMALVKSLQGEGKAQYEVRLTVGKNVSQCPIGVKLVGSDRGGVLMPIRK